MICGALKENQLWSSCMFLTPVFIISRRQKTMQVDATVFTCISMLSRAMGPSIQPDIKELLEPMLAVGLR